MYTVNIYEGRVSVRFEGENSTTVYMDETVAWFNLEQEALDYAKKIEDAAWEEYAELHTCPGCGHFKFCCCDDTE